MDKNYSVLISTRIGRRDKDGLSPWRVVSRYDGFTEQEAEAMALSINGRLTLVNRIAARPTEECFMVGKEYWSRLG